MFLNDLIAQLQTQATLHGNLPVVVFDDHNRIDVDFTMISYRDLPTPCTLLTVKSPVDLIPSVPIFNADLPFIDRGEGTKRAQMKIRIEQEDNKEDDKNAGKQKSQGLANGDQR